MRDLPISCELTAEQLRERRESLLAELLRAAQEVEPIDDGYRFRFSGDSATASLVLRTVEAERACCRFFRFALDFEQDLGPISFRIDGPAGTREFLDSLLAPEPST